MLKSEVRKKGNLKIESKLSELEKFDKANALIKKYNKVDYNIDVFYLKEDDIIEVVGTIEYSIQAMDARDGNEITHEDKIDWNDEYSLKENPDEEINIISGDDVDFDKLAIEQINANIPINLSHNYDIISKTGSGWVLMSEDEYEQNKNNQPDPRWDKLKEFNLNSEDQENKK